MHTVYIKCGMHIICEKIPKLESDGNLGNSIDTSSVTLIMFFFFLPVSSLSKNNITLSGFQVNLLINKNMSDSLGERASGRGFLRIFSLSQLDLRIRTVSDFPTGVGVFTNGVSSVQSLSSVRLFATP